MKKLAIIDLLFNWPPDGGARIDIKEVATHLSSHLDVTMFVPDFQTFCRRGDIKGDFDFEIVTLPFDHFSFNFYQLPRAMLKAVRKYRPDYLMIGDGWYLKPYLCLAFQEYSPIVRFYAYENLCLRSHGVLFVDGKMCPIDYLAGNKQDVSTCISCSMKEFESRIDHHHGQEFYSSLANSPRYRKTVIKALSSVRHIICYNSLIANRVARYNPNVSIIPSGVDNKKFFPAPQYLGTDKNVPHEDRKKIIFMPGRGEDPAKGLKHLIGAAKILRESRQDFEIWFTSLNKVQMKEKYVKNIGWFHPEELPNIYQQSTFCVIPSVWAEPFGIITLEAMSCAKPVIVYKIGGLAETVINNETGFSIPVGDQAMLAEKMNELLDNPDKIASMGQRARTMVVEKYNWETIIHKYYLPLLS